MNNTTNTKMTKAQQTATMILQNGYDEKWFSSKSLNKMTKSFYEAMARGNIALWDMAETLSDIDTAISDGSFAETDPEISSFTAYCEKVGIERSNYSRYVKAYREYKELKAYGFAIGVAVALLGTNVAASDFCANYTPIEMSVRKAQEWAKEYKARMLEEGEEQKTIETTLVAEEAETDTIGEAETETETTGEAETETETLNYRYQFTESTIESLIKAVAIYSNLTKSTDLETILGSDRVREILTASATRH